MADEFDATAAAAELRAAVIEAAVQAQSALPPAERQPLFREDHSGNLLTADGVLVRKKLEQLKLGGK